MLDDRRKGSRRFTRRWVPNPSIQPEIHKRQMKYPVVSIPRRTSSKLNVSFPPLVEKYRISSSALIIYRFYNEAQKHGS